MSGGLNGLPATDARNETVGELEHHAGVAAVPQAASSGSELISYPIDKKLHTATTRTNIDVKALAIDEQLAKLAHQSPAGALVELPGADVGERRGATGAA